MERATKSTAWRANQVSTQLRWERCWTFRQGVEKQLINVLRATRWHWTPHQTSKMKNVSMEISVEPRKEFLSMKMVMKTSLTEMPWGKLLKKKKKKVDTHTKASTQYLSSTRMQAAKGRAHSPCWRMQHLRSNPTRTSSGVAWILKIIPEWVSMKPSWVIFF